MLSKRIITSSLLIVLTALTLAVFPDWAFGILVAVFIAIGLYEFFAMVKKKGIAIYKYSGIIIGIIVPITVFLKWELIGNWELLFIVTSCLVIFALQFTRRDNSQAIVDVSVTMLGLIYISWLLSFLIRLRFEGIGLVAFLLLVTKMGDIGAYFLGTNFGKHMLIPRISPKKSIEGTVGGLMISVVTALVAGRFLLRVSSGHLLILGVALGTLAQIGDLSESLIKRDCQVKDSGKLLPGFGGVLDLLDSLLFTSPFFYFYIKVFV